MTLVSAVTDNQMDLFAHDNDDDESLWKHSDMSYSPPIQLGKSLEGALGPMKKRIVPAEPKPRGSVTEVDGAKQQPAQCQTVEFQTQLDSNFVFARRTPKAKPVDRSLISDIIGPIEMAALNISFDREKSSGRETRYEFQVQVPINFSLNQLLVRCLKEFKQKFKYPINESPDLYRIGIEDDGEKTWLHLRHPVANFRDCNFVIAEHFVSKEKKEESDVNVQINLPAGNYHKMLCPPARRVGTILCHVCDKRRLDVYEHVILWDGKVVSRDTQVGTLGNTVELTIMTRSEYKAGDEEEPVEIFWYGTLAQKYKTYTLYAVKKGISRTSSKEVVLGIDGATITQTFKKKKNNKTLPPCPIWDVVSCQLSEEFESQFTIHFKTNKVATFEAGQKAIAKEIVGKIQFLIRQSS